MSLDILIFYNCSRSRKSKSNSFSRCILEPQRNVVETKDSQRVEASTHLQRVRQASPNLQHEHLGAHTGRAWTTRRISSPITQVVARHSIPRHNPQRRSIQAYQVGPSKRRAPSSQMANAGPRFANERQRACQTSDAILLPHRKYGERTNGPTENDAACSHRQRSTGNCKGSQEAGPEEEYHQGSSE